MSRFFRSGSSSESSDVEEDLYFNHEKVQGQPKDKKYQGPLHVSREKIRAFRDDGKFVSKKFLLRTPKLYLQSILC